MDTQNEHLKNLQEIRSIMERSTRFISLSGLSGVFAGIVALMGALAVYIFHKEFFLSRYQNGGVFLPEELMSGNALTNFIVFSFVVAFVVLVLALFFATFFTTRNARRKVYLFGMPL
jgi:hypothetical protein